MAIIRIEIQSPDNPIHTYLDIQFPDNPIACAEVIAKIANTAKKFNGELLEVRPL
jgi:hypothetical protein